MSTCRNPRWCGPIGACSCDDDEEAITVDLTPKREPLIIGIDDSNNERITLDEIECPVIPGLDHDPGDEHQGDDQ